jgi:hypothetical protein
MKSMMVAFPGIVDLREIDQEKSGDIFEAKVKSATSRHFE